LQVDSYNELRELVLNNEVERLSLSKRLVKLWNNSEDFSQERALVATIVRNKETEAYRLPERLSKQLRKMEGKKVTGILRKEPRNKLQS